MKLKFLNWFELFVTKRIENFISVRYNIRKYKYFEYFQQRDDDIYITTYLKSGTTWMQMILYQMLTDGNMDFDHIYDVSPWITNEAHTGKSVDRINDLPNPRIIKSHDPYDIFDEKVKGRFIYVYRNGLDVSVSLFHHNKNYNNENITQKESFDNNFSLDQDYNWFKFTENWLRNKNQFNILYIDYDQLKTNFKEIVYKIAKHLDVELSEEVYHRIEERSSFEFMKLHESKFGEQPKDKRVYNQFIRKGKTGEGENIDEVQKNVFQTLFNQRIKRLIEKNTDLN